MSERRAYLDLSPGERRGVVTLGGRPERLMIERDGELACQTLGARLVARVRAINRAQNLAFVELEAGPPAVVNLRPGGDRLVLGQAVEVEIRAEARGEKGAIARLLGGAEGAPRLLSPGPTLEERLSALADDRRIVTGVIARTVADTAQEEALRTIHATGAGGSVAVEPTRALVAVDVDLGEGQGAEAKRAARTTNLAAIATAARVLRLKGLGGLVAIDLVGHGHDAPALLAAARAAFAPDNPGVTFAPLSRFGVLELSIPRRARPVLEVLTDRAGDLSELTAALALVRAVEREAAADGGARLKATASPAVARAAQPALELLLRRIGDRCILSADPAMDRQDFDVARL